MSEPKSETDKPEALQESSRSFSVFLPMLEDGHLNQELTDAVRDLVAKLRDHRTNTGRTAKGKLAVTIDFSLGSDGTFDVTGDFTVKVPKPVRSRTVLWATDGNNLVPQNPAQPELPGVKKLPPQSRKAV